MIFDVFQTEWTKSVFWIDNSDDYVESFEQTLLQFGTEIKGSSIWSEVIIKYYIDICLLAISQCMKKFPCLK